MNDAEIKLKVTIESKEAERNIEKFKKTLDETGKKIGTTGKSLTKNLTLPLLAAGTAAGGLALKTASLGDELAKTSTKLGVTAEELQDLRYWADRNGVSVSEMERAVGRLNQRVGLAATGNEKYAKGFASLGVSIHDANGNIRDSGEVMNETIEALRNIENPALRSATASEIFGTKLARDLMPALEGTSMSLEEAQTQMSELGRISNEDAAKAEIFTDAMTDMKQEFSMVFMELGMKLIPVMQDVFLPLITDKLIPAMLILAEKIGALFTWFGNLDERFQKIILAGLGFMVVLGPMLVVIGKIVSVVGFLVGVFTKLAAIFKTVGGAIALIMSPLLIKLAIITAIIAAVVWLIRKFVDLGAVGQTIANAFKKAFEKVGEIVGKILGGIRAAIEGVVKAIKGVMDLHKKATQATKKVGGAVVGGVKSGFSAVKSRLPFLDEGTNEVKREGMAYLHAGEAVVPKKYNPAFVGGGTQTINIKMPDISLDGRKVSRTIAPYHTEVIKVGGGNV